MDVPNLVTQCFLNVVYIIPPHTSPRIVAISSSGLTKRGHKVALPLLLKPMYLWLLAVPHKDKIGMERAIAHSAGWSWDDADGDAADMLGPN